MIMYSMAFAVIEPVIIISAVPTYLVEILHLFCDYNSVREDENEIRRCYISCLSLSNQSKCVGR
jgi:hypothetical protein